MISPRRLSFSLAFPLLAVVPYIVPASGPADSSGEPVHPHHARSMSLQGVGGKVSVSYMTVDFNSEHKDSIKPGLEWHMAFRTILKNEVALRAGKVEIPPGQWRFTARAGADAKTWNLVLRKASRKDPGEPIVLPALSFLAEDSDHMKVTLLNHGYKTKSPRDPEPTSGMEFDVRATFGDLHAGARFTEVLGGDSHGADGHEDHDHGDESHDGGR